MATRIRIAIVAVALAACHGRERAQPTELAAYLRDVVAATDTAAEVERWKLDEPAWRGQVVAPYDAHHAAYARLFDALAPALARQLARGGAIADRAHFAGDPALTLGQERARWALGVLAPARVATLDGAPIDAVFVRVGDRWQAIVGIDRLIDDSVGPLDRRCRDAIDVSARSKRCREVGWEVADAALRSDRTRLEHACALATTTCGKPTP